MHWVLGCDNLLQVASILSDGYEYGPFHLVMIRTTFDFNLYRHNGGEGVAYFNIVTFCSDCDTEPPLQRPNRGVLLRLQQV